MFEGMKNLDETELQSQSQMLRNEKGLGIVLEQNYTGLASAQAHGSPAVGTVGTTTHLKAGARCVAADHYKWLSIAGTVHCYLLVVRPGCSGRRMSMLGQS